MSDDTSDIVKRVTQNWSEGSPDVLLSIACKEIVDLRKQLAAAIKQRDEARRDAERYRWLKSDGCYWVHIQSRPHGDLVFQGRYGRAFYHHQGTAEMDDVIDSCIAAQRKGVASE